MDVPRAGAAGHAPHLQFDVIGVGRGVGDREGARGLDAGQLHHHVLARLEVDAVAVKRDPHAFDVVGEVIESDHLALEVVDRDPPGVGILLDVGLDRDVRLQRRRAGEHEAVVALEIHQGEARRLAMVDLAVQNLRLARPAQAMAAGVRQVDARAQAGVEDRLAFGDVDRVAERFDGEMMRHLALRLRRFSSPSPCSH